MKKNIIVATLVAAAAMTTASAFAADGTINFTGTVTDNACTVTNNPGNPLAVPMGTVSAKGFTGKGSTSSATKFTLQLTNCPTAGNASVKFDGISVAGDNSVLALTAGTDVATGVGIQLSDSSQSVLPLETASTAYTLNTAGVTNMDFTARYVATADTVVAGKANATASFSINYN